MPYHSIRYWYLDFYPRSPRGERRALCCGQRLDSLKFLSTLPARGATIERADYSRSYQISIHAPREGSDPALGLPSYRLLNFYPRSPRGERPSGTSALHGTLEFLSTLPARGATGDKRVYFQKRPISIHAPREGSDVMFGTATRRFYRFLSTLPARGATDPPNDAGYIEIFLSTLPARGATLRMWWIWRKNSISIHAPREGSDHGTPPTPPRRATFLSTLPARGATSCAVNVYPHGGFLSTLPARGATWELSDRERQIVAISIHAPREGSDLFPAFFHRIADISIHAPREGSDRGLQAGNVQTQISIHAPREGSDRSSHWGPRSSMISIHAPREGSDMVRRQRRRAGQHFYPRSPRGERPLHSRLQRRPFRFLSTLPARGATTGGCRPEMSRRRFLSTLPARGATWRARKNRSSTAFLSTLPARGATTLSQEIDTYEDLFLSTLPARGATGAGHPPQYRRADFYPRSPRGERRSGRCLPS